MAEVKCPMCSKPNLPNAEVCEFCGARITPVTAPLDAIKPGETPTPKKTSDLERTLPGWLRDARKAASEQDGSPEQPQDDAQPDDFSALAGDAAFEPVETPQPEQKPEELSPLDFLSGLAASADDEEETPDWLKSLGADLPEDEPLSPASSADNLQDLLSAIEPGRTEEQPKAEADEWAFDKQNFDFKEEDGQEETAEFSFDSETPDWLNALKNQQDIPAEQPRADSDAGDSSGLGGDLPSWLDDLAADSPQPVSPSNQPESTPLADDSPDWLASLSAETHATETPAAGADDSPDWLASLSAETHATETPAAGTDDSPDWLASLSAETPATETPAAGADDSPDWLASLSAETPATETPAAGTDDSPDWLASLSADTPATAETPVAGADDSPDWLASLSADTPAGETPAAGMDDSPDWLASLSADTPAADETPAAGADDSPDWLASLSAETPATETPAAGADDSPDWLASLSAETPATETPAAGTDDSPDWLASLSADTPAADETPAAGADDSPDWLASLSAETPATETPSPTAENANMPDWLSQAVEAESAQEQPAPLEKKPKAFQTGSLEEISLNETPDWMASLESSAPEAPVEAAARAEAASEPVEIASQPEPASASPFEAGSEESLPNSASQEDLDSILSMDVPDWLAGFTPNELEIPARSAQPAEAGADDDIAPVNLPSWVQAMRPVESFVSEAGLGGEEMVVEQQGPLAGLRAVLPAQAGLPGANKSRAYSMKLRADDVQQSQAALLDALVQAEQTPRPTAGQRKSGSNRILRWVVAAVLFTMVFAPSLLGTHLLPVPNNPTSNLSDLVLAVNALEAESPVLVVLDYQPALAGEMEAAFSPVLNDLMIRGNRLGFVSTLPTGPLMVERMVTLMKDRYGRDYQPGLQYVDLGYLPGDAAGIQAFARWPRAAVGPRGQQESFWDAPFLAEINGLNDFSALVIVTDNPDTGRIWVEQAGMVLQDRPILMVISAQAEPVLRPYYDSGQVRGMLTGLAGGAVYEAQRGHPALAHDYWDAFGFGLLGIQTLILVGGGWNLVSGILARRKERDADYGG